MNRTMPLARSRAAISIATLSLGLAACEKLVAPGGPRLTTGELIVLPVQTAAAAPAPATLFVSNGRSTVRNLIHADAFSTQYARLLFPAGSLASLNGQPLGSGDSVLVTVQARPGQYGITISPRGLSLSAGSLPTVVFSFGRYGDFTVAGSSTRYASAQEYATALDVWREVTADGWSMATGSRTAGTDAVEAQIEAPGDYAVAAPR